MLWFLEHLIYKNYTTRKDSYGSSGNTSTCFNGENYLSVMFLESYVDKHGSNLMKSSYSISIHEHNHPGGGRPSGYLRNGIADFNSFAKGEGGDSNFSYHFSKRPISSSGIKFYVNPQGENFKYEYNGTSDFNLSVALMT